LGFLLGGTALAWLGFAQHAGAAKANTDEARCASSGDLALVNGKILTMGTPAVVSELVIRGGRVVHVGPNGKQDYTSCTRRIDLKGRTTVPGLIDGHIHLVTWGFRPGRDVRLDLAVSVADVEHALAQRAATVPPGKWVTAVGGWTRHQFTDDRLPTLEELDRAAPKNPVFIWEREGTPAVTNTLGRAFFEAARITVGPDGQIATDGNQAALAYSRLAHLETDSMQGTRDALAYLNQVGVTTAADAGVNAGPPGSRPPERSWHSGHVDVYTAYDPVLSLAREHQLPVRVRLGLSNGMPNEPPHDEMRLKYQFPMFGNEWISTLCMGELIAPPDPVKYDEVALAVAQRGWCHEQHTMGGPSIKSFVDSWEKVNAQAPIGGLRWRLAHVMDIAPADLERLKRLQAGVSVSPMLYAPGASQPGMGIAYGTIVHSGVKVGGVSDGPNFLPVNPWVHIAMMVTGKDGLGRQVVSPDQALSRIEALQLYTVNNGWFMGDETLGTLQPGSFGDVAVLDRDYLTTPTDQIRHVAPVLTIVGGRVVYTAPGF
jgi:predicted amidohydrolase YtcJ